MAGLFESDSYIIRQKVLKLLGEEFHIYSDKSMKNMIGYSKQKALKLKEDIRVYSDEQKTVELLRIKQSGMLDFKGNFEIRTRSSIPKVERLAKSQRIVLDLH